MSGAARSSVDSRVARPGCYQRAAALPPVLSFWRGCSVRTGRLRPFDSRFLGLEAASPGLSRPGTPRSPTRWASARSRAGRPAGAVTSVTLTSPGVPASAPAGSYPIVPSNAVGSGLANYTISSVNGTLKVKS